MTRLARSIPCFALIFGALCMSPAPAEPAPGLTGPANLAALKPTPLPGLVYDAPFFVGEDGQAPAYAPNVPTGEELLGYAIGQRAATHGEIERCFKAWDGKGPAPGNARAKLFEYGKTWEGRALYYMVISSEENILRLEERKQGIKKLSDQREVSQAEADRLAGSLPAVAWMAYSIHGDETSGADAALALAYHLIAATDDETKSLLNNLIIIIDPLMNPDGRDRFLKMIAEHRAANPNIDNQSLLHSGYWPYGRTNHYFFDLNRDWIFATQPETRGRIAALREWNPQLFIDAHEMYSQDTFLMSPPREPYNVHHPVNRKGWMEKFAAAQAKAFDRYGWRYYTGEWNEGWYPGYSDSWAAFRGAIGMLFEQARLAEDGVRRAEGTIQTYRESVHHQAVGSLANLRALRDNKAQVMADYAKERREAISGTGPYADKMWVIDTAPERLRRTATIRRLHSLRAALGKQGILVGMYDGPKMKTRAVDPLGRIIEDFELNESSLIIPGSQMDARLAATLLETDPKMTDEFLRRERRELLRYGHSRLYDTTAWNLGLLHDLPVYTMTAVPWTQIRPKPFVEGDGGTPGLNEFWQRQTKYAATVGWSVQYGDMTSAAARLLEHGVRVRIATRDGNSSRGRLVILRVDNPTVDTAELEKTLLQISNETSCLTTGIESGLGAGNENPDLGSEHFALLTPPRIAILSRGALNDNNVGECWFTVDQRLGVRATLLDIDSLSGADLRRYNVLIAPDAWDTEALMKARETIGTWVRHGGTLIAIGSSAAALASAPGAGEKHGGGGGPSFGYTDPSGAPGRGGESLTSVRLLPDVLENLDEYELQVMREWEGLSATVDAPSVWSNTVDPSAIHYPWQKPRRQESEKPGTDGHMGDESHAPAAGEGAADPDTPHAEHDAKDAGALSGGADEEEEELDADEITKRDQWNRLFMPTGAILATRLDDRHWLTMGCRTRGENLIDESDETAEARSAREAEEAKKTRDDYLPVLYTGGTILMAGKGVEAPIRFGFHVPAAESEPGADGETSAPKKIGWARNPPGHDLILRMSGLLWPEAAVRIANSAFVTREGVGDGQVILFACSPTFRGATLGTSRVFENAIVFGPGLGARAPIIP